MGKQTKFLFLTIMVLFFTACSDDDNVAQTYTATVTVTYPNGYDESVAEGITVTITHSLSGSFYSAITDASGTATFEELEAGIYEVSAVGETEEFALNGVLDGVTVSADASFEITLEATALEGGLVFKEIYYTGSKTLEDGSYYSDQFHEIYNNSDETIYLDGLCIGLLNPTSSSESVWVDNEGELMNELPLQFHVWYIPGDGDDYPLEARTSIVIAQDGIDHQTDEAGNPNSPVNLGSANWETYCGDINDGKDADAPGVPNLSMMFTTSTTMYDWLHSVFGSAVVIFRLPEGTDPVTWAEDPANLMTKPGSTSTTEYLMVPKDYVIDAVEVVRVEEEKRYKRLPSDLDAGKVWCSGTYVSESIRRKVKQIIDGKVIYQDTNNSSEDFLGSQTPTPFEHPLTVD
ncbi:DUF4876 domain-containing protein [Abyssalbus ytuae]|uniref:DUF4876 domain-containing protein n=1 Tax=Abyssalbus ytuae TaxID=2926907 RepID=A0A9E7CSC6_9FLAO|nr:DUF4876 domain-containing protein [Abyssalbus ytuae]UOB16061.1 DUF4876 domain-containing protein [Abyssalbus ytuae]